MRLSILRVAVVLAVSAVMASGCIAGCVREPSAQTPTFVPTVELATKISERTNDEVSTATANITVEVAAKPTLTATPVPKPPAVTSNPTVKPTRVPVPTVAATIVSGPTVGISTSDPTATVEPTLTAMPVPNTPTVPSSPAVKPTHVPVPTVAATIVSEPKVSISTLDPTATVEPTVTLVSLPTATVTATPHPSPTETPSPTPYPLDGVRFVDNEDCVDGIDRELLPTMELAIEHGDVSQMVVVEVADEAHERQQGLMCRETIPSGSGMLFVFESARPLNFWMFNTYAPLDIVYLGDDKRVVRALRMEPCPRPEGADSDAWRSACSVAASGYGSVETALYALELPAGWLASVGLGLENLEGVLFSW